MVPKRPILRYPGGKWRLAPWIISHFPAHSVYVEPFCGAGSVLLRKPRATQGEVLNDLDGDVVNLFRILRSDMAGELIRQIELTPFARDELDVSRIETDDPIERARRFMVRSYMGRGSCLTYENSGFRSRRLSNKTPPWEWVMVPAAMMSIIDRLQGVVIENNNALEVLERYDGPDVLFYVDPPYPIETRTKKLYAHEMSTDDHIALSEVLHRVSGAVVISGYRCKLYDELYSDWRRSQKKTYSDGASERTECLWLSPHVTEWGRLFE